MVVAIVALALALVPLGVRFEAPLASAGPVVVMQTPRRVPMMAKKTSTNQKKKTPARSAGAGKGFGAPPVAAAPAPRKTTARPPEWLELDEWLSTSGASCGAVELFVDADGLRGVRTTRRVQLGDELMRIPRSIILDEDVAEASPVSRIWSEPRDAGIPTPPPYARLALLLLHEARRGAASPFAQYIRLLPSADDFAREGGPTSLWLEEELALLECDKLISDTRARRQRVEESPVTGSEALRERWAALALPGDPPTAAELRWAVAAVTSRAYGAQLPDDAPASLLIPMVDMANHRHPPNTGKGLEGDDFVVLAAEELPEGAQAL